MQTWQFAPLPRQSRKKYTQFFRSEPAKNGSKEKQLSDVDQRHAVAVAWLRKWTPKRFPTLKSEFRYNDDIQSQQDKRVAELEGTVIRLCELIDVSLLREQGREELQDSRAKIMGRLLDITKAAEEPYLRLLYDYNLILDAIAIASAKVEMKRGSGPTGPDRATKDDRETADAADDNQMDDDHVNNEKPNPGEGSADDEGESEEEYDTSDDDTADYHWTLLQTRPGTMKRRKSAYIDTDEEAKAAIMSWRRRSSMERSRQRRKRRSNGNSPGSSDSFSKATGASRVERPLRLARNSTSSWTGVSRPGSEYPFQHVRNQKAREDVWAALFGPNSQMLHMPNLPFPEDQNNVLRDAINQAVEDARRRAQREEEGEEWEEESSSKRFRLRDELDSVRWSSDSRHASAEHATNSAQKEWLGLDVIPATRPDLENSPFFEELGPPPVVRSDQPRLQERAPPPDDDADTDTSSSDFEVGRLSPILEKTDSVAGLPPTETLDGKIQAFRIATNSQSQGIRRRCRSNSLPTVLNVDEVSISMATVEDVAQVAAPASTATTPPLNSRLVAFVLEQQAAWASVLWFLLAPVVRRVARPCWAVLEMGLTLFGLAWDTDWCQPQPLTNRAFSTVQAHTNMLVLAFAAQAWLAVRNERNIWLEANHDTREYLLDYVRQDPSWWWLPGVDPKLMLKWSELPFVLWLVILCYSVLLFAASHT